MDLLLSTLSTHTTTTLSHSLLSPLTLSPLSLTLYSLHSHYHHSLSLSTLSTHTITTLSLTTHTPSLLFTQFWRGIPCLPQCCAALRASVVSGECDEWALGGAYLSVDLHSDDGTSGGGSSGGGGGIIGSGGGTSGGGGGGGIIGSGVGTSGRSDSSSSGSSSGRGGGGSVTSGGSGVGIELVERLSSMPSSSQSSAPPANIPPPPPPSFSSSSSSFSSSSLNNLTMKNLPLHTRANEFNSSGGGSNNYDRKRSGFDDGDNGGSGDVYEGGGERERVGATGLYALSTSATDIEVSSHPVYRIPSQHILPTRLSSPSTHPPLHYHPLNTPSITLSPSQHTLHYIITLSTSPINFQFEHSLPFPPTP